MLMRWKRDSEGAYLSICRRWYIWRRRDEAHGTWHMNYTPDAGATVYDCGTWDRLSDAKCEATVQACIQSVGDAEEAEAVLRWKW